MAKIFHPLPNMIEFVDATCGEYAHPDGTQYRVAIGNEIWDSGNPLVLKIQIVYKDTGLQGRRSPSFPLGYDDFERVNLAVNRLLKKAQDQGLKFRM